MRAQTGFTLIEILVTLLIVGILGAAAALALGDGGAQRRLEQDAATLAALVETLTERALVEGSVLGLEVQPTALRVYRLHAGRWQALRAGPAQTLDPAVRAHLTLDGLEPTADAGPQLMFGSDGERTPFDLTLRRAGAHKALRVRAGPFGPPQVQVLP